MEYIRSGHYDIVRNDYGRELVIPSEKEWTEVKHGRWVRNFYELANGIGVSLVTCDQCYSGEHGTMWNYCPNCGARMESEQ